MTLLINLLKQFWRLITGRPITYKAVRVEDLPERLDVSKVYIAGEGEYLWYAAMVCPCGCGETLHLSLMPDNRPRWTAIEHNDRAVSLHPSVWRQVGCKSHFWLKSGHIRWC